MTTLIGSFAPPVEVLGCPRCAKPSQDGLLCSACLLAFERAVADLGVLLPELAVTVAKRDEVSRAIRHHHRPADEAPAADLGPIVYALVSHGIPINVDAVAVTTKIRYTLTTWVAHLRARYGDPAGWAAPSGSVRVLEGPMCRTACRHDSCVDRRLPSRPAAVRSPLLSGPGCDDGLRCRHATCDRIRAGRLDVTTWLLASSVNVRRDDAAAAIVTDLVKAARTVEVAVDRRDPELYVGPCDQPSVTFRVDHDHGDVLVPVLEAICGVDLYARVGDSHAECEACGARYVIADRKAFLAAAVRDVWARPALIAQALAALDLDLTAARLDTWISRDKRRHQRDCVARRHLGPVCEPGCGHDSCEGARLRPWECWRGHIVPVCDDEGGPVSDRPVYRVGDVLDRVEALRDARAARDLQEAI